MLGDQGLVGRDHRLAQAERRLDRLARRALRAADQLDEEVDVGRAGQLDRIVEPGGDRGGRRPGLAAAKGAHAGDGDPRPAGREVRPLGDQLHEARADRPQARDADAL